MVDRNSEIKIKIEMKDNCIIKVDACISPIFQKHIFERALSKIAKSKSIPSFRKGKAPQSVILQKFGDEVSNEAARGFVSEVIHMAIVDTGKAAIEGGLKSVDWIDMITGTPDKSLNVSVEFEYVPTLMLDIESIAKECVVDSKDIDSHISDDELERLEKSIMKAYFSSLIDKSEGISDDDVITFDIYLDGVLIKEGSKTMVSKSVMNEDFYRDSLGKKIGDSLDVEMGFSEKGNPMYYKSYKSLDNKKLMNVKICTVQKLEVPEIDEKIATEGLGAASIEDFRNKLRIQASGRKKIEGNLLVEEKIKNFWFESNNVQIPGSWVDRYTNSLIAAHKRAGKEVSEDEVKQIIDFAKKNIAFSAAIDRFVKEEDIQIVDRDFMNYINKMVISGKMSNQEAGKLVSSGEVEKHRMRSSVLISKATDMLVDRYLKLV
ncbi:MAG: hypothetical protein KAH32_02010 [Chlamydiia bacterium]|nr:hypothetical protein [Chlamydiia bacterium]